MSTSFVESLVLSLEKRKVAEAKILSTQIQAYLEKHPEIELGSPHIFTPIFMDNEQGDNGHSFNASNGLKLWYLGITKYESKSNIPFGRPKISVAVMMGRVEKHQTVIIGSTSRSFNTWDNLKHTLYFEQNGKDLTFKKIESRDLDDLKPDRIVLPQTDPFISAVILNAANEVIKQNLNQ